MSLVSTCQTLTPVPPTSGYKLPVTLRITAQVGNSLRWKRGSPHVIMANMTTKTPIRFTPNPALTCKSQGGNSFCQWMSLHQVNIHSFMQKPIDILKCQITASDGHLNTVFVHLKSNIKALFEKGPGTCFNLSLRALQRRAYEKQTINGLAFPHCIPDAAVSRDRGDITG